MRRLGHYLVAGVLGGGGIATIHRARDERTGADVALKVLRATDDATLLERFRREALTLRRLDHPNIVKVIEVDTADGETFMVLELLAGSTLQALIAREGPLPLSRALAIADRILTGLAYAHEHDIVHRDVKPSNVMLLEGDVVKLIDFGLAKVGPDVAQKLTETGTVHGTPHYMSPEQCRGEDVGPASDIYSVGVLLHEMLAGQTPFAGSDAATLMAAHLFVDPPVLEHVPVGVAAAVRSALAKRPEDRPSAPALRTRLGDALAGVDPATRRQADAERRVGELAKPREERALGGAAPVASEPRGLAFVWMPRGQRSAALLSCLGTAGIDARLAEGDDVPGGAGVIVLSGLDRLRRLRERDRRRPAIVVDVRAPEETAEAIRLGADDMLLREAVAADLVAKVQRLLRRKGRP